MRPALKRGLRRVWRDRVTLQFGADPHRAFALTGLGEPLTRLIDGLDGTRDRAGVLAHATALGVGRETSERLLEVLAAHGALEDAAADTSPLLRLEQTDRERLAPDLESLTLLGVRPDEGLQRLRQRQGAAVRVLGAGRVGSVIACHLAAAGVGRVLVEDARPTTYADLSPGGLGPDDVGSRRDLGVVRAIRELAPSVSTAPAPGRDAPDLTVLAPDGRVDPVVSHAMMRHGVPHLYAGVQETTGIVGPLVLPGRTSCLHCHDLFRSDRDPAWPTVLAQLWRQGAGRARDTTLAAAVAVHATLEVLAHLEGQRTVATVDGTLELSLDDGRLRRRSWRPHPACGCRWAELATDAAEQPPAS